MPNRIVYQRPEDATKFDLDRFVESINKYDNVSKEDIVKGLEEFENYDTLHVSCLVEVGVKVIPNDDAAAKYYDDHSEWFGRAPNFERLRRITGYLVGTLERWNDAKQAEEKARVKHNVGSSARQKAGQFTRDEKAEIEAIKLENSVMSQF